MSGNWGCYSLAISQTVICKLTPFHLLFRQPEDLCKSFKNFGGRSRCGIDAALNLHNGVIKNCFINYWWTLVLVPKVKNGTTGIEHLEALGQMVQERIRLKILKVIYRGWD